MNIYPRSLPEGGTIGVVAPSSAISTARVTQVRSVLENMGYRVVLADNLDAESDLDMAGDPKHRAENVNRMFADPAIDAIICARGGNGSSRIMEYLDYEAIAANPKIFCGYSDITNLLLALVQRCHLTAFHGPMVSSNMVDHFDAETKHSFFEALNTDAPELVFSNPAGKGITVHRSGVAEGELIGGNISVLAASIGTPYELETKGRILFIEELGDEIRRIEKAMTQLRNSGKLHDCAGILMGQFTNCPMEESPRHSDPADYLLRSGMFDGLNVPIFSGLESGHDFPMMTLPMGAMCRMDGADGSIRFRVNR